MWRKTTPKGLKLKKFIGIPDGTLVHDSSYVGEDAWDEDRDAPEENIKQMIENNERLDKEKKKELTKGLGVSGSIGVPLTIDMGTRKNWLKCIYLFYLVYICSICFFRCFYYFELLQLILEFLLLERYWFSLKDNLKKFICAGGNHHCLSHSFIFHAKYNLVVLFTNE